MAARRVAVIADSSASLPPQLARDWGIIVVPLEIIGDGQSRSERPGDAHSVVADLESGRHLTTSQPTPEAFARAFDAAVEQGADAVVVVAMSGELSGTAALARAQGSHAAVPVTVVDSRTVAMAQGFAAVAAARMARASGTQDQVAAAATQVAASSTCLFTVDTLEYLRRGGRLSAAAAAAGRLLGIRPVLAVVDGAVEVVAKARSTARARLDMLDRIDMAIAAAQRPAVAVMTLGNEEAGQGIAQAIAARHALEDPVINVPVSAVLGVHAGPGVVAVAIADLAERA